MELTWGDWFEDSAKIVAATLQNRIPKRNWEDTESSDEDVSSTTTGSLAPHPPHRQYKMTNRIAHEPHHTHLETLLDDNHLRHTLDISCCARECMDRISKAELRAHRDSWTQMDKQHRIEWMRHELLLCHRDEPTPDSHRLCGESFAFKVKGHSVCSVAWCRCYGVGFGFVEHLIRDLFHISSPSSFSYSSQHTLLPQSSHRDTKTSQLLPLMSLYFQRYTDVEWTTAPSEPVFLEIFTKKQQVYEHFTSTANLLIPDQKLPVISRSLFESVWREHFPFVQLLSENRYCPACAELASLVKAFAGDSSKQQQHKQILGNHLQLIHIQKQLSEERRILARLHTTQYFSVLMDYMRHKKMPHFGNISKEQKAVVMHIGGWLVDNTDQAYYLFHPQQFPESANTVLSGLHYVLSCQNSLPPKLWLESDSHSTNKAKISFGYLEILVRFWKIFEEVEWFMGVPEHSYNRMDQRHTSVAYNWYTNQVCDLDDVSHVINLAGPHYQGLPMSSIWDFEGWLSSNMHPVEHMKKSFAFKFSVAKGWQYKEWASDAEWKHWKAILGPVSSSEPPFYTVISLPHGFPQLLSPQSLALDTVKKIRSVLAHLPVDKQHFFQSLLQPDYHFLQQSVFPILVSSTVTTASSPSQEPTFATYSHATNLSIRATQRGLANMLVPDKPHNDIDPDTIDGDTPVVDEEEWYHNLPSSPPIQKVLSYRHVKEGGSDDKGHYEFRVKHADESLSWKGVQYFQHKDAQSFNIWQDFKKDLHFRFPLQ